MVKPTPSAPRRARPDLRASAAWLTDAAGAVLVAGGIALLIKARVEAHATIAPAIAALLAGGAIRALAPWSARIEGQRAAARLRQAWRHRLIPALLPSRTIRQSLIGQDMHLAVDSVAAMEGLAARFLPLRAAAGLSPLLIAAAAAPASPVASLIMLATLVPFILAMALAGTAAARRAERQHEALARLSGLFVDRIGHLPTILSFGAEERIARHLGQSARDVARRTMDVLAIAFASSAILEFFAALSVALVAVYCGFALLGLLPFPAPEHLSLPRAFFVLALAPEFYLGLRRLAAAYHDKQQGEAAATAMNGALAMIPPAPAPFTPPQRWAGRGVLIAHPEGSTIGPLDWNWHAPGLHVISGPTGSGKTSLLQALIGHAPLVGGAITGDGAPFTPGALNAGVGWAGQQVALLPGTLRANLAMGAADDAVMLACLERLHLGPMLARRGGLDMAIDHRGSGLSGGERRRIGLARAILSGRPILLLDEPTADLDAATAGSLRLVLADLSSSRMVVAATHDEALIAMAGSVCAVAP